MSEVTTRSLEQRVTALENLCKVEGCNNEWSQKHHVIPIIHSEHDRNEPFNPITNPCLNVCDNHHDMIHEIKKNNMYKLGEAIRRGQQKAKANGVKIGRKTNVNDGTKKEVWKLKNNNVPVGRIAKDLQIGVGTVYKILDSAQVELCLK
tara:strand:+ start:668 stop:1114 length:447 start_codon:yes stop_codon:yes gene_type:complete